VATSFNAGQVRHRGGAIFLHVNGSGATAGCVSAPRWFMVRVMNRLDHDRVPVIAIGR
jgi:L,D-peptidoglycan transpeptidase YkuD (ErfK/YbiS/YcfS/YnhG family)